MSCLHQIERERERERGREREGERERERGREHPEASGVCLLTHVS
jgi:hypothetical protein